MTTVPSLVIHLNAGCSKRVADFVNTQKNPLIKIVRQAFGDYSHISLTNMKQEDIDTFLNKFKAVYPTEWDYNYKPPAPVKLAAKPKSK